MALPQRGHSQCDYEHIAAKPKKETRKTASPMKFSKGPKPKTIMTPPALTPIAKSGTMIGGR